MGASDGFAGAGFGGVGTSTTRLTTRVLGMVTVRVLVLGSVNCRALLTMLALVLSINSNTSSRVCQLASSVDWRMALSACCMSLIADMLLPKPILMQIHHHDLTSTPLQKTAAGKFPL